MNSGAKSAFTPKWCFGIMTMWLVGLMTVVKRCISGHWSRGGLLILKDDWPHYKKIKGVVLRWLEGFILV